MALFSATIPDWVAKLEEKFLSDPLHVTITPAEGGESTIEQIAYQVPQGQKIEALCALLRSTQGGSSLVFGRTKYGVERLGKQLSELGFTVGTLHGNKSQRAREDVLTAFRRGHVQTLLATNVAARGLDIHGIYQVINYELPESSELFTHRVGRTGRMGRQGKAITLLVPSELPKWRRMARNLGQTVALQRLVLDEVAAAPSLLIQPEPLADEQQKQRSESAQHNRNRTSSERVSQVRLDEARRAPADAQKPQQERRAARTSTHSWQPESPTMRPRLSSRAQGKQASSGRTSGRLKTGALREMPPRRAVRRKINSSPAARTYASKRSGRR